MSQNSENSAPEIEAGEKIIDRCPICQVKFKESVALNIKHLCPNPQCAKTFCIMMFD